jgi:hypothetical protein
MPVLRSSTMEAVPDEITDVRPVLRSTDSIS